MGEKNIFNEYVTTLSFNKFVIPENFDSKRLYN